MTPNEVTPSDCFYDAMNLVEHGNLSALVNQALRFLKAGGWEVDRLGTTDFVSGKVQLEGWIFKYRKTGEMVSIPSDRLAWARSKHGTKK